MTVGELKKILEEYPDDLILVDGDGAEIESVNDLGDGSVELNYIP